MGDRTGFVISCESDFALQEVKKILFYANESPSLSRVEFEEVGVGLIIGHSKASFPEHFEAYIAPRLPEGQCKWVCMHERMGQVSSSTSGSGDV